MLKENHGKPRPKYDRKVFVVTTQLADDNLITEDNPLGLVQDTWNKISVKLDYIPDSATVLNPGTDQNELPKVEIEKGKHIVYVFEVRVVFPQ